MDCDFADPGNGKLDDEGAAEGGVVKALLFGLLKR
jgi:hypothetical protein